MEEKTENRYLYFLEGAACIGVVFLHCTFPSWLGIVVCGLARFAVPLFFMVSGYYLWRPGMDARQLVVRIKSKISHIMAVLLGASIFYLIWSIFREFIKWKSVSFPHPYQIFAFLVLNDFTFLGGHLWFLAALLYCYIFSLIKIRAMGERDNQKKWAGIIVSCLLLCIHVFGRIVFALLDIDSVLGIPVYILFRNWLFMAFPFIFAGHWICRNQNLLLRKLKVKQLEALFFAGVLLTTMENVIIYRLTGDDRELYLGTFLMVFSMFLYALCVPEKTGILWVENIGRHYLLFIYIVHLAIVEGMNMLLAFVSLDKVKVIICIKPFIVLALTGAGAVLWNKKWKALYVKFKKKRGEFE